MIELSIHDINQLCQRYLTLIYQRQQPDLPCSITTKHLTETSGEIRYQSVDKLLSYLSLTENDVFMDVGSGTGKVVIQVFLKSLVKEALGIEIVSDYHKEAIRVSERVRKELPEFYQPDRKLHFIEGSFLEVPLNNATVVFINSTCFSPELMISLGNIINKTHHIHTVATTRPIPNLSGFTFKKTIRIDCTWDFALCYFYNRKNS